MLDDDVEEIKVGDYIRTNIGTFDKIIKITISDEDEDILYLGKNIFLYSDGMIKKHSKNLIDLVEVGDFVNGHLVADKDENTFDQKTIVTEVDGKNGGIRHLYTERRIETILTHEQYERNCYHIKEDKQ